MAGRFVILEFDDPQSAESFIENRYMPEQLGYRQLAMFILPTKFCECPDKSRQHADNWKRGKRTGLQLCVRCRRPSKFHTKGLMERLEHIFGYNQVSVEYEEP